MVRKIINLSLFTIIIIAGTFLFFKYGDIRDYFNRGEHYSYVSNDMTTLIVITKQNSRNENLYKAMASIGKEYEGRVQVTSLDEEADLTKTLAMDLNLEKLTEPSAVLLNHKGDIIAVYKDSFPYENLKLDLERIFGK